MTRSKLIGWATASVTAALLGNTAGAATYYWDALVGDGAGGMGTWNTSTANWKPNADGSGTATNWVSNAANNAVFGGTAGIVTLETTPTANTIQFDTPNYVLEINQANITVSEFSGAGESTATIRPLASPTGARTNTITVPASTTATYDGLIANNGAAILVLKKDGAGTLKLTNAASSFGGLNILSGTLETTSLANSGSNSAIGAGTARISFTGATGVFKYSGSADGSTDRALEFNYNAGAMTSVLDAAGEGSCIFTTGTSTDFRVANNFYSKTLKLTGVSTANNRLDLSLADSGTNPNYVVKEGAGKWILTSNAHTYSGGTTIKGGLLAVNNTTATVSGVGAGDVSLDGGTLGGTGYIGRSADASNISFTASGGGIAPGSGGAGRLTVYGDVNFTSAGAKTLTIDIAGTTVVTGYDQLQVNSATGATGAVTLDGATLNLNVTFAPLVGSTFTILDKVSAGDITGTFAGLTEGAEFNSGSSRFKISYVGGNGNDVVLTTVPIPEPTALGVVALGGMMLLCRRRAL